MSAGGAAGLRGRLARASDRLAGYLPILLMAALALATYLLARNTPVFGPGAAPQPARHEADYFLRGFSVKSFEEDGRLRSEVTGTEGRHYPDTDTLEIDQARILAFNERGDITRGTARKAISNADGSEVQLIGDAVIVREAGVDANGRPRPRMELRSEFLHFFANTERVRTHKPAVIVRGRDEFRGDSLDYDNLDRVLQLQGRVQGTLQPASGR